MSDGEPCQHREISFRGARLFGGGEVDKILTAGGKQLARAPHAPDVVLLQHRGGFVQSVFEHLGGLQLSKILRPLILPVKCEGAQSNQGESQSHERSRRNLVKTGEEGRLALYLATAQGPLDQLHGAFPEAGRFRLLSASCLPS